MNLEFIYIFDCVLFFFYWLSSQRKFFGYIMLIALLYLFIISSFVWWVFRKFAVMVANCCMQSFSCDRCLWMEVHMSKSFYYLFRSFFMRIITSFLLNYLIKVNITVQFWRFPHYTVWRSKYYLEFCGIIWNCIEFYWILLNFIELSKYYVVIVDLTLTYLYSILHWYTSWNWKEIVWLLKKNRKTYYLNPYHCL